MKSQSGLKCMNVRFLLQPNLWTPQIHVITRKLHLHILCFQLRLIISNFNTHIFLQDNIDIFLGCTSNLFLAVSAR